MVPKPREEKKSQLASGMVFIHILSRKIFAEEQKINKYPRKSKKGVNK